MQRIFAIAVGVGLALAGSARADEGGRRAAVEYMVEADSSAAFEVPVNAGFVTVLYFPEDVVKVVASDKERFSIVAQGDAVTLRPTTSDEGITANLNVQTASLKVSVILKTVAKPEAVAQVVFKRAEIEAEIQKRIEAEVDRRMRESERRYEARRAALDAEVRMRADAEIAGRLLGRHETIRLEAIARNDDNVVVRVPRAVFVGSDAYVYFEIQNRDRSPYRLAAVTVSRAGKTVSELVRFERPSADGKLIGTVPSGQRATGVVVVRDADRLQKKALVVTVAEPGGKRAVAVDDVVLR